MRQNTASESCASALQLGHARVLIGPHTRRVISAVTMPVSARRIAAAYERWGKGLHPAALNFGDCFAYEVANDHGCRLLYVGEDFGRIDLERAA